MSDEMAAHWWEGDAGTVGNPPRYSHSVQHSFPLFRNVFLLRVLFWSSHGKWDEGRRNEWKYVIMESEDRGMQQQLRLGSISSKSENSLGKHFVGLSLKRKPVLTFMSHITRPTYCIDLPLIQVRTIESLSFATCVTVGFRHRWIIEFQPQEKSFKSQSIIGSWFKTKLPNYNSLSPPMLIV